MRRWESFREFKDFKELKSFPYELWATEPQLAKLLVERLLEMLQGYGRSVEAIEAANAHQRQSLNSEIENVRSRHMAEHMQFHENHAHWSSQLNSQLQGLSQEQQQAQDAYRTQVIQPLAQNLEALKSQRAEAARVSEIWRRRMEDNTDRARAELAYHQAVHKSQMPEGLGSGDMTKQIESACQQSITGLLEPNIPDYVRDQIVRMYSNKKDELKKLAASFLEQNPPFLVQDGCNCNRGCAVQALLDNRFLAEESKIISIPDSGRPQRQLVSFKTFRCKQHPGVVFRMTFDETSIDEQRIIEVRAE